MSCIIRWEVWTISKRKKTRWHKICFHIQNMLYIQQESIKKYWFGIRVFVSFERWTYRCLVSQDAISTLVLLVIFSYCKFVNSISSFPFLFSLQIVKYAKSDLKFLNTTHYGNCSSNFRNWFGPSSEALYIHCETFKFILI